ncbi:hypothetical protein SSX86_011024 [Deinandra increscens subsp. villosa]|uniref:RING-type domain-containing protein n=1 Tax=Deinandra increscens subsp. villosa TaxID=3103831 RepID=A0AAP0DDL1_9ASTR
MAVEAGHHHTLFRPQMMITNGAIDNQIYAIGNPHSATATPMYCSGFTDPMNAFPSNAHPLKAESGLTCSFPVSRKRARDCSDMNALFSFQNMNQNPIGRCETETCTFLGKDVSLQIRGQQLEMDRFISYHTEKVRLDVEERRKRNSRRIIAAVEEGISKRLRAKEEEIVKISKLNWALEEKVKSLCAENQIWRELAQTNEATANALRSNLKQVLEQAVDDEYRHRGTAACVDDAEDAQSCCESNNEEKRRLIIIDQENMNRLCKKCGYGESCVLLLPCRHLCLCTLCASSVNTCPLCKSTKNISVHVNLSS